MMSFATRLLCRLSWAGVLAAQTGIAAGQQPAASPAAADIRAHQEKARGYLQQKKPALAIPEFGAIVAIDPNNLDAQANLGVLQYFTAQFAEAEPHLRAALGIDPNLSRLQALLGFCEHQLGQFSDARNDLTAALPKLVDPKIRRQAGLELVELDTAVGDLPAAAVTINQLKAAAPTDPEILYAAYRVYTDLAGEAMLDLSVAAPDSAQMHQAMAHELIRERDNPGAVKNLRAAVAANPNLPGGHLELAEALHASSEPAQRAEAEAQYQLALQANPKDDKALTRLGDLAAEKGDHTAAIAHYKHALSVQPANTDAALGLAHELVETDQAQAALPLLLGVIKADPTDVLAHYRLSAAYRRLHRPEDAKREIAEYERLKALKDKLREIYQAMRMDAPQDHDELQTRDAAPGNHAKP